VSEAFFLGEHVTIDVTPPRRCLYHPAVMGRVLEALVRASVARKDVGIVSATFERSSVVVVVRARLAVMARTQQEPDEAWWWALAIHLRELSAEVEARWVRETELVVHVDPAHQPSP
jgi:hypothetical protein